MTHVIGSEARLMLRRDLRTLVYSAMTESSRNRGCRASILKPAPHSIGRISWMAIGSFPEYRVLVN